MAALDFPVEGVGNEADTGPAVLIHLSDVLHTLEVGREILSFLLGGLLANGIGFVDIVNAQHLKVVRAFVVGGGSGNGN